MTVKQLRELIAKMPDDAKVVTSGEDHSYQEASASDGTALYSARTRSWTEDYGEKFTPEKEYGKRLRVLIVNP